ncbi:MAG TPA: hypothetical protein VJ608_00950 [Albitalea sp.]|nr:hypothetical protein [Albitalea sp.]
MHHRSIRTPLASALLLALAACGGGGSDPGPVQPQVCSTCTPGTLSGTLASGAPLALAEITVIDAVGTRVKATGNAAGGYKLDVATLQAPFVIEVLANVGGETVLLHSFATADDVGKNAINVTPLTELITATLLGGNPATLLAAGSADFSKLNAAAIAAAEAALEARVQPVLAAAGVGAVDLRTTEFHPDHTGLDKALDALHLATSGNGYVVSLVAGGGSITVDPSAPGDASALPAPPAGALDSLVQGLGEVRTMLSQFASQFAGSVPSEATLTPYFDAAFLHDGQNRSDFINKVLRKVVSDAEGGFSYQGVSLDALCVTRWIDADTLELAFRVKFRKGFAPGFERLVVKRVGGQWVFLGNHQLARVHVNLSSRLKELPMPKASLLALSGVHSFLGSWEGPTYTYYQRTVPDLNGNPFELWLGREGDTNFGNFGWAGNEVTAADRKTRHDLTQTYTTPDARVSNYIVLTVDTARVSADVAAVVVTGPGLPSGGLTLEPPIRRARDHWVFKGDSYDWNAFNAERCAQVDNASNAVPGCGLNWGAISKGSTYTFTFKDGSGNTLGTLSDSLRSQPVSEATAYAQRNALFPQLQVDTAHALTIQNVFDDANGPFLPGKSVPLAWTVPTQAGFRLIGLGFTVQTATNAGHTDYPLFLPMYDSNPLASVPTSATLSPTHPVAPNWVWTTLNGVDAWGNVWDHELSPFNPR